MPFAVCVTFTIHPHACAAFLPLMYENAKSSLTQEKGCLRFDVLTDPRTPNEVFLYELYAEAADFHVHLATAHFRSFDAAVQDMIAHKVVKTYEKVRT